MIHAESMYLFDLSFHEGPFRLLPVLAWKVTPDGLAPVVLEHGQPTNDMLDYYAFQGLGALQAAVQGALQRCQYHYAAEARRLGARADAHAWACPTEEALEAASRAEQFAGWAARAEQDWQSWIDPGTLAAAAEASPGSAVQSQSA